MKEHRFSRRPSYHQTKPAVGDVFYSPAKDLGRFSGLMHRGLTSFKLPGDGIARISSFCSRLARIAPRKGSASTFECKSSSKTTTFTVGGHYLNLNLSELQDFRQNPSAVRSSALEHDAPQESLRRVGADVHPAGNLLGCVSLTQELEGFSLPLRQVKPPGGAQHVPTLADSLQQNG